MVRYGMVIDLKRCIGCYSCMVSCKAANFVPPGVFFARVLIKEYGKYPNPLKLFTPVLCNNCKDAACVRVCPSGATTQREDGIVLLDYNKCVGCRYCMMACPYGSRCFYKKQLEYFPGQGLTPWEKMGLEKIQTGVVMKCTFCQEKVDVAVKKGLKPGLDREATPVCVNACPSKARYFGDLNDPVSEVSRLIREERCSQLHPEFGTDPSVYYIR